MKIFLVEDSPIVQQRLVAMLSDIDQAEIVGVADNDADAITGILCLQPDAAVLDIRLRSGNGIDVLREIQRQGSSSLKIMLSNYTNQAFKKQCLEIGANYFFDKANEFERVTEVLTRLKQARQLL